MAAQKRGRRPRTTPPVIDVYARISRETDEDRERRRAPNTADQIADCLDAIAERGAQVGVLHEDVSLSAWNRGVTRPEWQALMARLQSGEADGVMFQDVTRFTRKVREGEDLLDAADGGALVWSISGDYDLTTASGRKHFRDAVGDAEHESDRLSERTTRGKRRKALRGRSNASWRGFAMPGYAPRPDGWQPGDVREPVADEVVRRERWALNEVADRLLAGATLDSVTRWLAAEGITTVTGKVFTSADLRQLLLRPSLAGILTYDGEEVGSLPGEPAMDREKWENVGALFASRKRGPQPQVYLLSGLLRCGNCGSTMSGRPRTNRAPYPDGAVAREYWCRKQAHGVGCGRLNMDQRTADALVEGHLLATLSDPRHAARIAKRADNDRAKRSAILAEKARLTEQADNLAEKVAEWGLQRVEKAMGPILRGLEARDALLAQLDGPEASETAHASTVEEWEQADLTTKRAMVRRTFPRLTVRPANGRGRGVDHQARMAWDGV